MDLNQLTIESFLEKNRISNSDWEKANINFDLLKSIAADHQQRTSSLYEAAEYMAKILQKCAAVHSVRWRVKNSEHVMEKIVRKRAENNQKYLSIDNTNYMEILTDLVGVRVLHLFKYEWEIIHDYILSTWEAIETPVAYIRSGDEGNFIDSYKTKACDVKEHPVGYRSVHYVISTQPTLRKIISEIQVRTIFEEGWSEIDHRIRYPNFSDNQLISYFLTIFNRMAGSADEMGSFVKNLTSEIACQELKFAEISRERNKHLSEVENLALELAKERKQGQSKDSKLEKLNEEIKKLRSNSDIYINFTTSDKLENLRRQFDESVNILGNSAAARFAAINSNALNNSLANFEYLNSNIWKDKMADLGPLNSNILKEGMAQLDALAPHISCNILEKSTDKKPETLTNKYNEKDQRENDSQSNATSNNDGSEPS